MHPHTKLKKRKKPKKTNCFLVLVLLFCTVSSGIRPVFKETVGCVSSFWMYPQYLWLELRFCSIFGVFSTCVTIYLQSDDRCRDNPAIYYWNHDIRQLRWPKILMGIVSGNGNGICVLTELTSKGYINGWNLSWVWVWNQAWLVRTVSHWQGDLWAGSDLFILQGKHCLGQFFLLYSTYLIQSLVLWKCF